MACPKRSCDDPPWTAQIHEPFSLSLDVQIQQQAILSILNPFWEPTINVWPQLLPIEPNTADTQENGTNMVIRKITRAPYLHYILPKVVCWKYHHSNL